MNLANRPDNFLVPWATNPPDLLLNFWRTFFGLQFYVSAHVPLQILFSAVSLRGHFQQVSTNPLINRLGHLRYSCDRSNLFRLKYDIMRQILKYSKNF
jgi:hypothetical protein